MELFKLYIQYCGKYHRNLYGLLIVVIILVLVNSILGLAFPVILQISTDNATINRDMNLLIWLFAGLVFIKIITEIIGVLSAYLLNFIGNQVEILLRFDFIRHMLHLPISFYEQTRSGEVVKRIADTSVIRGFTANVVTGLGTNLISFFVFLIAIFVTNFALGLVFIILVPLYLFFNFIVVPYYQIMSQMIWEKNNAVTSETYEMFQGMKTVKAFALENKFLRKVKRIIMDLMRFQMGFSINSVILSSIVDIFSDLISYVFIIYGAYQVISNHLTIGGLLSVYFLQQSLMGITSWINDFQSTLKSVERFHSILSMDIENKKHLLKKNKYNDFELMGGIAFDHVYYAYQGSDYVLKDISLEIKQGETIAIVGKSGAGKTTLTNLIPCFYTHQKGVIYLDGHNIREFNIHNLRHQIGIVQQEPFLFSGTILDNIRLGMHRYSEEQVHEAAKLAHAYDFIMEMPDNFKTILNERGAKLSVGQKQRVSIARVFLINPKILILDEPTSALDLESEKLIQDALKIMSKGRTTIIIAHRLSTIRDADRIVVMDDGNIAEIGKHDELIALNGHYASLYNIMGRI